MDSSLCGLEVSKAWRLLPVSFTQLPKTPADGSKLGPEANLDLALCESKGAWVFLPCARAVGKYPGCLPSWEGPLALPQKQSCLQTGSVLLHVGSVPHTPQQFSPNRKAVRAVQAFPPPPSAIRTEERLGFHSFPVRGSHSDWRLPA